MTDLAPALLSWYENSKRPLPWRENVTAYRVWVSEIMLQQTRIEAARGYFTRFMEAFPTVQALAAAREDEVLKLWEGLGYYSRARNLHACAKIVSEKYGGAFPADAAALRALPGIGDYTAGAVASIAFGLPEPAVDGNVVRVLSRFTACGEPADEKLRRRYREELRALYRGRPAGELTSALMELGETVCLPGAPRCADCPLSGLCLARAQGNAADYPVLPEKRPRRVERRRVLLMVCGGRTAFRRRPEKGLLAGLWELPNDLCPEPPEGGEPCGEAKHAFTHVEWHMKGYILRPARQEGEGLVWLTREERQKLAVPSAFRVWLAVLDEMGL